MPWDAEFYCVFPLPHSRAARCGAQRRVPDRGDSAGQQPGPPEAPRRRVGERVPSWVDTQESGNAGQQLQSCTRSAVLRRALLTVVGMWVR